MEREGPQHNPENDQARLARKAGNLFIKVSNEYSGSFNRQGAGIALALLEDTSDSAEQLEDALRADAAEMDRVHRAANTAHKHAEDENPIVPGQNLPLELVHAVIEDSFGAAAKMKDLPPADLQSIIDFKPWGRSLKWREIQRSLYTHRMLAKNKKYHGRHRKK